LRCLISKASVRRSIMGSISELAFGVPYKLGQFAGVCLSDKLCGGCHAQCDTAQNEIRHTHVMYIQTCRYHSVSTHTHVYTYLHACMLTIHTHRLIRRYTNTHSNMHPAAHTQTNTNEIAHTHSCIRTCTHTYVICMYAFFY